jgi:hypothetical protein
MRGLARTLVPAAVAVSAALAWLAPAVAIAQPAASHGAARRSSPPITLRLELPPGSALDAERLRATIARELGVLVVAEPGAPGGTLVVRQEGETLTVAFDGPGGRRDARSITAAADPAHTEQDVALVAVNVARDQTQAFLEPPPAAPPEPPAPQPPPAPPPPADPTLSPCAEAAAARARTPVGVDFVPLVGTSSIDAGRSVRTLSIGALGAVSSGIGAVAVSGLVNVDAGPVCGVEAAGLVNVAGRVEGLQVSGIAGVAADGSRGAQVSLVNVAAGQLRGVQIGLVNVARDTDAQIGLVNVDLHGRTNLQAWSKPDAGTVLAGLQHGPEHMHTIYGFGMSLSGRPWAVFGMGAHLTPTERVWIDLDLLQHTQLMASGSGPNQLSEARAVVGYRFLPHFAAYVGPTFNVLVATDLARAEAPGYASVLGDTATMAYRAWPGVAFGVEAP